MKSTCGFTFAVGVALLLSISVQSVEAQDAGASMAKRRHESEIKRVNAKLSAMRKDADQVEAKILDLEAKKTELEKEMSKPKYLSVEERLALLEAGKVEVSRVEVSRVEVSRVEAGETVELKKTDVVPVQVTEPEGEVEIGLSLDLASAYVFRGATFNNGMVLQPGIEVSGLPVTFGVWGNVDLDDYDGALESGQVTELDIYASYDISLPTEAVGLSLGYCEYTYPGGALADREASLSLAGNVLLAPTLTVFVGLDGLIEDDVVVDLAVSHEVALADELSLEAGALLRYVAPGADGADSGLAQYELSLSLGCGLFSVGMAYVGQADDELLVDVEDGGSYDVPFVATLGVSQTF